MVNVNELTLEEKAALTSGADAWHLTGVESKGIPGYMITDGPHGLRKMKRSTGVSGLYDTVPSTCFPPAAGFANSWNPELVREVGVAMGEECVQEKVAVILGPGVNIKRNPLGGRCFEYWSEDPVLAGRLPAALIEGVQSQGIGTSLKHFAANNQETDRMRISARITERALREIYLSAFEYIVKHAKPWTMMCSYNQINGVFSSENPWLLTKVLRDEWGYDGIVMSDWGAVHDRAASVAAGLNLEMPPSNTDDDVVIAVREGRLDEKQLDRMAQGMLDLLEKARPAMERDYTFDKDAHHALARRAAQESIVLLKNDCGILPLAADDRIAVIGEFARTPRYQGGGSSHINPTRMVSFLDALAERGVDATFAPGFTLDDTKQDGALTGEAVAAAQNADKVVMFLGLPDLAESEGYDRTDIDLPAKQIEVLHAVAVVNPNVVVVLSNGAVVSVRDWQSDAKGLLEAWLLGQAGGQATADVLYGDVDATGRLSETIPLDIEDNPSTVNFPGGEGYVDYGEGIFVGYRYYDSRNLEVAYPFGYGLSYTEFEIGDARVEATGPTSAKASVVVTNVGDREGSQVVQVYVAPNHASSAVRPCHELKAFAKVHLVPGESRTIEFDLDDRAFAYWSERYEDWHVEAGDYMIEFASSSRDVADAAAVTLDGDGKTLRLTDMSTIKEWLDDPVGSAIFNARAAEFEEDGSTFWIDDEVNAMFFLTVPLNSITTFVGPKGRWFKETVLSDYDAAVAR
ncbi:exo-alpha-(1-_6)-L-arabinopyranosidase [Bifidobacterium vansinderenii]|uniref:Exo-alpha-(1->6)-L-arabinopyranosidase n=1 Tax=Bifidobacterium vansinderenii TaxID=1984871 RepID=A0A229VZV4_9BIFI|nr:exo-alpha-(1->6)-L-arabinopyranosidase [Bifidobacterium vansinderenii]OXN01154.1 glycosyl hydrolase [Bifidobacterium vansinderenii]